MILVLTTQAGDYSHIKIVDWLDNQKADYLILTGESLLEKNSFKIKDDNVYYKNINLTDKVSCVFYRRWYVAENDYFEDLLLNNSINKNVSSELYSILEFLSFNLNKAIWFPKFEKVSVNKIQNLSIAKKIGLNVPEYIITNNKKDIIDFHKKNNKIITKAINNFGKIESNKYLINVIYTKSIDNSTLLKLNDFFFPSFFQKYIDKVLELRILYFNESLYTTAILSQMNDFSKIDSRRYENNNRSKIVNFNIEKSIEEKIIYLMKELNLNIGCLDFILSKEGTYHFLEVNPVGQIAGYSERCVLDFEKNIIDHLIELNKKKFK